MHLDSCTRNERMSEDEGFDEEEEEMESGGAALAEQAEARSQMQGASEDRNTAIGEGRGESLMEAQATQAPSGVQHPTSVQGPLQFGMEVGVGFGSAEGEGIQTAGSVSTMPVALPVQPIAGYVRQEGMPSAFASRPDTRAFVPVRETAERLSGAVVGPARLTSRAHRYAVPPAGTLDYTEYYGVPGQTVYYVLWFGAAFVHQLTGTFYACIERMQRFGMIQGYNSTSNWASEFYEGNTIPGALVDPRLPAQVEELPQLLEVPNRFLIMSQFGPGPASVLGTALPMPFTPGMPQIPWVRNFPDSVVWRFRDENMVMVLATRQVAGGAAVGGARTRSSTPVADRAGGSQRAGPARPGTAGKFLRR